jgi:hypothetical protein
MISHWAPEHIPGGAAIGYDRKVRERFLLIAFRSDKALRDFRRKCSEAFLEGRPLAGMSAHAEYPHFNDVTIGGVTNLEKVDRITVAGVLGTSAVEVINKLRDRLISVIGGSNAVKNPDLFSERYSPSAAPLGGEPLLTHQRPWTVWVNLYGQANAQRAANEFHGKTECLTADGSFSTWRVSGVGVNTKPCSNCMEMGHRRVTCTTKNYVLRLDSHTPLNQSYLDQLRERTRATRTYKGWPGTPSGYVVMKRFGYLFFDDQPTMVDACILLGTQYHVMAKRGHRTLTRVIPYANGPAPACGACGLIFDDDNHHKARSSHCPAGKNWAEKIVAGAEKEQRWYVPPKGNPANGFFTDILTPKVEGELAALFAKANLKEGGVEEKQGEEVGEEGAEEKHGADSATPRQ